MEATSHVWLLSMLNVASAMKALDFPFYLILVHFTLKSHMGSTIMNSTGLHNQEMKNENRKK